ncbi:mixed lineage kinase domain-like protein [Pholidichthys leucotaenia]
MDIVEPILSLACQIYELVDRVKANKKRCRRVCERVRALEDLVKNVQQTSEQVDKALKELHITLGLTQDLIRKYTESNWVQRVLKASDHVEEFNSVNERLNDAFQVLSGALQIEHGNVLYRVFEQMSRDKQDEEDGKEDDAEIKRMLTNYMTEQQEKFEAMRRELELVKANVLKVVDMMSRPSATSVGIRMIKPEELTYDDPKRPFMTSTTSEVYRGQYRGFSVAIKRYIDPINTNPGEVRSIFNKEVDTMKRFESPNILRMFGICVKDDKGFKPQFFIVMEYCEKGSLREVLDREPDLSWPRKTRMCLDAARGLYQLHQAEEKYKVHGCINSKKFMVDQGFRIKLGGFELAKTDSSLKKTKRTKGTKGDEIRSLCYYSPERLNNINEPYTKECEIYSFGIVLWEIATSKKPFDGCTATEIHQKVCINKHKEDLPEDCPKALGELIDDCRAYDPFHRPSAGVLMDKLHQVVNQLEELQIQ